jgi:formiminotetrahydrofolate cyclodeaminase
MTLEACVEMSELAYLAARDGNPNTISDAGSAALISEAAGKAAAYNVKINLPASRTKPSPPTSRQGWRRHLCSSRRT